MKYYTVYIDGNGVGYSAAVCPSGKEHIYFEPDISNNTTEYNGVILALFLLPHDCFAIVRTDSQLVCGHLERNWKINHEHLKRKVGVIRSLLEIKNITMKLEWIPRKQNIADRAIRKYMKRRRREAGQGCQTGTGCL